MTSALPERYAVEYLRRPDLSSLIRRSTAGKPLLLHVHVEERAFAGCETDADALVVASQLTEQLATLRQSGGRIVWTIHNGVPHRMRFLEAFVALRQAVADSCDVALVHDRSA